MQAARIKNAGKRQVNGRVATGELTPAEGQKVYVIAEKILKTLKEQNAEASSCEA